MKILITGANGQVAFELQRLMNISSLSLETPFAPALECLNRGKGGRRISAGRIFMNQADLFAFPKEQLDITQADPVFSVIQSTRPDIVINTAAYTQVDNAEKNPEQAFAVNRDGAKNLAIACEKIKCLLIHLSTDYIFNGQKNNPYVETDAVAPLNIYGKSKWEGEEAIRTHCEKHVIIRVSAVFGVHGNNFVKTILRLAGEKEILSIISDQMTCPTPARDIAKMVWQVCENPVWGTYHYCGEQATSWYAFAEQILMESVGRAKRSMPTLLKPIPAMQYPTPAQRPKYSVLDCEKIKRTYNIPQPNWQKGLADVLNELSTT